MVSEAKTTFNESAATNLYTKVNTLGQDIYDILLKASNEMETNVGTSDSEAAYSGSAAYSIMNQWGEYAATFAQFRSNFEKWYNEGREAAVHYKELEDRTRTVDMEQV